MLHQEYSEHRPLAYPKTDVFLVCFCVCSFASYKNVRDKWVPEIRLFCPTAPVVVVGTQLDRRGELTSSVINVCHFMYLI